MLPHAWGGRRGCFCTHLAVSVHCTWPRTELKPSPVYLHASVTIPRGSWHVPDTWSFRGRCDAVRCDPGVITIMITSAAAQLPVHLLQVKM